ncbi:MAG: YHS domain-containing protein [Bacteroidia bacterium]
MSFSNLKFFLSMFLLLMACTNANSQEKAKPSLTDPVCGKKVDATESYDWKYAGKVYSFDSYDCRNAFKMNPQNFLVKHCVADMTAIDPVCGMKVNKAECYDHKFNNTKYHFCSFDCRETFKMAPAKFANNKCAAPDTVSGKK